IRKERVARTLYGFRRVFFDSSEETGREGFSHMVSGTVSDYNNETLISLEEKYGQIQRLLHNAHDGDKIAFKRAGVHGYYDPLMQCSWEGYVLPKFKADLKQIIERAIRYESRTLTMTADIKVYI